MKRIVSLFPMTIGKRQSRDTGEAMVLMLLLLGFFTENEVYYKLAIPALIMTMASPRMYYPLAVVWLGLSTMIGNIMTKVLLAMVFILMVLPVGYLRKILGKSSQYIGHWKEDSKSVLKVRNKSFVSEDLVRPF